VKASELKCFACFADLSQDEREAFADALVELDLASGESLFYEGDEGDGLLLLVTGRLRLARREPALSGSVGPGTALGAVSLVAPGPREATAVADGPCRVLWLKRAAFRRVVDDSPRGACRFVEHVLAETTALLRPGVGAMLARAVDPGEAGE